MSNGFINSEIKKKELLYQVAVHLLIFAAFSITKKEPTIKAYEFFFFLNYAVFALIISYLIIPHYNKHKNLGFLIGGFLLALLSCILVEELLIEKIFFPADRGQNIQIFWTVISVLSRLSLLVAFKLAWDIVNIRKEVDSLKQLAKENELQFLKTQINPHFLFNNLNNIYSYALEASPKTPEIILELSGLLRYMLYDCKQDFVDLEKEIEQLKNFIKLNELQIENRGIVNFNASGDFVNFKIAPLILIVFIENAFKHSVSSLTENIKLEIATHVTTEGMLQFNCVNNFSDQTNNDNLAQGIGLKNVIKRLDLIYGDSYKLDVTSKNGLFKIDLLIPLKTDA